MGQQASLPEPEELLDIDDVAQPQPERNQHQQPHSDAKDEKQAEEQEAADSEQQQPSTSLATAGWLTLKRWLPSFSGGAKKRRRDEASDDDEHADADEHSHSHSPPSASCHPTSQQHKHIRLSVSASAATSSSSSHSSPSHSCTECDTLRAQVADLQQQLSHTRSLSSDLTCAVCHFLFLSPVTTECGHSWCLHCLVKSLQSKRQCPLCRSAITQRPMTAALLLTSQLQTTVNQLTDAEKDERLKELTRRLHERIDYDMELTRLVPPASRRTRYPVYDDGDGIFRCPWCSLEVQFADSCCMNQCGPIDWSEEMDQHEWQQALDDDEQDDDELHLFEVDDDIDSHDDPSDDEAATEPYWNDDGSFSCMSCGEALEYQQYSCCRGPIDWTEVYRTQAEAYELDADGLDVDVDGFDEDEDEEEEDVDEFAEEEELDDDGFDDEEQDDEGEAEWVDGGDGDDYLAETAALRRQILYDAGVEGEDEEVSQLRQQHRRERAAARAVPPPRRRPNRRRPASASEFEAIMDRLFSGNEGVRDDEEAEADEDEVEMDQAVVDVEQQLQLAEVEETDEEADVAELQAVVDGGAGEVDDGEAELDFVTGHGQRIARQDSVQAEEAEEADEAQAEEVPNETELEGMYWSGDDASNEPAAAVDNDEGEVEWAGA